MARDVEDADLCACGLPLHYPNAHTEAYVREQIAQHGPTIDVITSKGVYAVPRHYIALHGLRAWEIPDLADQHGWLRLDGARADDGE
jgi:hypothetical protein